MALQSIPPEEKEKANQAAINGDVERLKIFLSAYRDNPQLTQWYSDAGYKPENTDDENARLIIRYTHHFNTWAEYENFKQQLKDKNSPVSQFEHAADAIAGGDASLLSELLQQNPELIRMRSVRNHHATLLIYVGANGIEQYRQRTPKNAAEVAGILLKAGAEVDALGDMYGGSTTLGLVATSVHPVITGNQQELMEMLIRHGADVNHGVAPDYTNGLLILACIANGRGEPIRYLADHGAVVDLEAAGALGDLEKVRSYFNADGSLIDGIPEEKKNACFTWASEYGHIDIVEYLLATGISSATKYKGMTALHSAAFGGQLEIVKLLLNQKAPLEVRNAYDGTPLSQTLWCAYNHPKPQLKEIMETLIDAGAKIEDDWRFYINEVRTKYRGEALN